MLQVSMGGYFKSPDKELTNVYTPAYYEPGFLSSSEPLVFTFPEADRIFILIRKRADNSGNSFTQLVPSNFDSYLSGTKLTSNIVVTDSTKNALVPAHIDINNVSNWIDSSLYSPVVLVITNCFNIITPSPRVRAMDCFIRDNSDGDFICFRVLCGDSNKLFNFLVIDSNNLQNRNVFSSAGREAVIKVGGNSDNYLLFSPYAYLKEVEDGQGDFSYPFESIYYKRQEAYNDEGYNFSIDNSYHMTDSFIADNISVFNALGYDKAGVLMVDKYIYQYLSIMRKEVFIDIKVVGKVSGNIDYFRVYLVA